MAQITADDLQIGTARRDGSHRPAAAPDSDGAAPAAPRGGSRDVREAFGDMEAYLEDMERDIISAALEECRWNKTATAKLLGISFRSLRYRLKKLGLDE